MGDDGEWERHNSRALHEQLSKNVLLVGRNTLCPKTEKVSTTYINEPQGHSKTVDLNRADVPHQGEKGTCKLC